MIGAKTTVKSLNPLQLINV